MDLYKGPGARISLQKVWGCGGGCVTIFWWWISACGRQHEPKWLNMVHILGPKASKKVKHITFFWQFHFWTMSQFCHHMSLHKPLFGRVWRHLGPIFLPSLPPPSQDFLCVSITIPHWSSLKHLGPSGGHLGQMWCPLGSILVHFGQFWTHWGRTWNKI